jgi:hypothetical protein
MMRTAHFYDLSTGVFTGESFSFSGRDDVLASNTPPGCGVYEGDIDWLSNRIDVETKQILDYQPPPPDVDHEWNLQTKRWQKRTDVVAREQRTADAIAEIQSLEKLQVRSISELLVDPDATEARDNLERRKARIDELRHSITAGKETTSP